MNSFAFDVKRLLWSILIFVIAGIVLFPVFWLLIMAFKPDDVMFARPTVWLFHRPFLTSDMLSTMASSLTWEPPLRWAW